MYLSIVIVLVHVHVIMCNKQHVHELYEILCLNYHSLLNEMSIKCKPSTKTLKQGCLLIKDNYLFFKIETFLYNLPSK